MMKNDFALVRSDIEGRIVEWDSGAEEFFGYSATEALGESLDLIVPEEFRERHWVGFRKTIATGVCRMDRATTNVPVRRKDGSIQPFPGRFVFLQDARDCVVGVIALYAKPQGSEKAFGPLIPLEEGA
jgi:PAS domain S-box-containing protein